MEENTVRKIHPILQILLIAAITLVIRFAYSLLIGPFLMQLIKQSLPLYQLLNFVVGVLGPLLGGFLCFKVIENRELPVWALLLIVVGVNLVTGLFSTMFNIYIGRLGGDLYLARWAQVNTYLSPLITAAVIVLFVNLLAAPQKEVSAEKMHISLVAHVLLLLFLGGIWRLVWIYRTTRYLNCVPGEEYRNPATKLLLCMFIPFYSIYWVYKSAQRIDKLAATADVVSDLAVICLILEIFVPLIPPILMQDKINKIIDANTTTV